MRPTQPRPGASSSLSDHTCTALWLLRRSYRLLGIFACIALAACQPLARPLMQDAQLTELQTDLETLTGAVVSTQAAVAEIEEREAERNQAMQQQLAGLDTRLGRLPRALQALCPQPEQPLTAECPQQPTVMADEQRLLLGELERVWLAPPGVEVTARMDTGADSSSVNAQNLTPFERDGEDWVRFEWVVNDETHTVERPIERYVRVVQQADPEGTRRPVVSLRLRIGTTDDEYEFTLADRSHLEYQMILGRNFLTNVAVVDVGRRYVQPRIAAASR